MIIGDAFPFVSRSLGGAPSGAVIIDQTVPGNRLLRMKDAAAVLNRVFGRVDGRQAMAVGFATA